ncbi:MAG: Piwi domain-containing protein [Bacteroidota bacterium]
MLSYDGQSKVSKKSIAELLPLISPTIFNLILSGNRLDRWTKIHEDEDLDPTTCFPVINKSLEPLLGIPAEVPPRDNRYPKYLKLINAFYKQFLDTEDFQKVIPLNKGGFLTVNPSSTYRISSDSNKLLFGGNVPDAVPKYALKKLKPFQKSPYPNIHLFFIVHKDDKQYTLTINSHFEKGYDTFDGMQSYVGLLFHTEAGFSIVFEDKENPIPEIEKKLSERQFDPDVKYMAIYVTPYSKFEKDKQKREIYFQLKELLLKRKITSQAIDPAKMVEQGINWKYSLPNIAVAMLAKLDGIPWRLNTPVKNELIVGIGAFKHIDDDVRYIGSAFSFNNNGKFNRFEYFLRDEIGILAGSISDAVRQYATVNNAPDRLIIHFYKTMSEEELEPIRQSLIDLKLNIPVFIITINKTESEDIVAFDKGWKELMPLSGIFIGIGNDKFLLFNNTRYYGITHSKADGYPFPIKLKLQCTVPDLIKDTKIVTELIDQIYQFSRMYWKSIRQQNLPVTIKYPEIIAEIAPHFLGNDIPAYGKDNLWFL